MSLVGTLTCETNSFTYPVVVNRSKNKPRTAIDFFHLWYSIKKVCIVFFRVKINVYLTPLIRQNRRGNFIRDKNLLIPISNFM